MSLGEIAKLSEHDYVVDITGLEVMSDKLVRSRNLTNLVGITKSGNRRKCQEIVISGHFRKLVRNTWFPGLAGNRVSEQKPSFLGGTPKKPDFVQIVVWGVPGPPKPSLIKGWLTAQGSQIRVFLLQITHEKVTKSRGRPYGRKPWKIDCFGVSRFVNKTRFPRNVAKSRFVQQIAIWTDSDQFRTFSRNRDSDGFVEMSKKTRNPTKSCQILEITKSEK
jgi:hypothetical protein